MSEERDGLLRPRDQQQSVRASGLHGFVQLVLRRLNWIVGSVLICILLAVVVTIMTTPVYDTTATIELNKSSGGSLDLGLADVLSQQVGGGDAGFLTDQQTETAILQGDSLALDVIQRLGLASQPPFL